MTPKPFIDPAERMTRVELTEYNPAWPGAYSAAATEIKEILKDKCLAIHHMGSTAIPNIYAKPIIDVLVVVNELEEIENFNPDFEKLNYICMGEYGMPGRRFYWRSKILRTHNIHLFAKGSTEIDRHLKFKNYMLDNPDYARAYSIIKQNLAIVFSDDIENYVNGKASFVRMIDYKTATAKSDQLTAKDNIILKTYNSSWPKLARAEIEAIKTFTQLPYVAIEHIGSTAVEGLASKPIIDIIIALNNITEATPWIQALEKLGYIFWSENPDKSHHRLFKGMPPYGIERTHHIHIVEASNSIFEQRILFRDILRKDVGAREEYAKLKMKLAEESYADRELYTERKRQFIIRVLRSWGFNKDIDR